MLDLLRGYYGLLVPLLESVACAPLPEGAVQRASSLHQRAWLLQVRQEGGRGGASVRGVCVGGQNVCLCLGLQGTATRKSRRSYSLALPPSAHLPTTAASVGAAPS